ncbi:MAG: DegV family protein [Gemmiger sp.]
MSWMIVSDTSCEIRELENPAPGVQFALAPFKIRVGEREYVDLPTLNVAQMLQAMTDYNGGSSTACPSPEEWAEQFLQADNVIALTISHNLSGSYNAALSAREMVLEEHPEKNIFVLDTLSCAGALTTAAWLANDLIGQGKDFEEVTSAITRLSEETHILFALASFDNLAKAGRVNRVVGFIAGKLNMRVLGRRTSDGKIDFFFKTRGETRVLAKILEQMDEDGFDGSHTVVMCHCNNENATMLLQRGIRSKWPNADVRVYPCSGLCSFYAQDQGIILTY